VAAPISTPDRHSRKNGTPLQPARIFKNALALALLATQASAAPQPESAIATAITMALGAQPAGTSITLGSTAGAAAMPACTGTLNALLTGTPPYEQAAVTCPAPFWTLYVTVTLMTHASVAVATRPIAAGATITPDDIALQPEPVSLYAGRQVFYDTAALPGATALMSLPAGAILTTASIAPPVIIRAGQSVAVAINIGNITVSLTATALQQGRIGDTITLTNPSTGKHFSALVTPTGPVVNLND
jgi:flagella basal body P-ring formation protein FlgA